MEGSDSPKKSPKDFLDAALEEAQHWVRLRERGMLTDEELIRMVEEIGQEGLEQIRRQADEAAGNAEEELEKREES